MPKIKITNLKAGACVINSLKIIIPGMGSVVRDDSVIGDPDLSELENLKVVSIQTVEEESVVNKNTNKTPEKNIDQKKPEPKNADKNQSKTKVKSQKSAKQNNGSVKEVRNPKIGTDFRAVDVEDTMGAKVVIIGENGPEIKKMNPGINGNDGPKFVGDDAWNGQTDETGFITL